MRTTTLVTIALVVGYVLGVKGARIDASKNKPGLHTK